MYILGINAYHGDAAAAIARDGELIATVEEERFNRVKHCAGFPARSIEYCLRTAGITIDEVEHIGISRNPAARLHKRIVAAGQRLLNRGVTVMAKRQVANGAVAGSLQGHSVEGSDLPGPSNGNGYGRGAHYASQLKDRLRNAARVYDLKREVARVLSVSVDNC